MMKSEKKISFIFIFVFSIFFCCFVLWILYEFIDLWSKKRENIINYARYSHNHIKQIILFHSYSPECRNNKKETVKYYTGCLKSFLKHLTVNTNISFIGIGLKNKGEEILKIDKTGVLSAAAPKSSKHIWVFKNRLVVITDTFKVPYYFIKYLKPDMPIVPNMEESRNSFVDIRLTTGTDIQPLMVKQQDHSLLLFTVVFFLSFAFFISIIIGWYYSIRYQTLSRYLATMKNREEEFREFSLIAAGLTHETKNPLGIIRGLAQQIFNTESIPAIIRSRAEQIMEQADVTTARLGDFLSYAKIRDPEMQHVNLKELILHIKELISADIESVKVKFEINCEDMDILADKDMLSQLLMNLLLNSLKFVSEGDFIKINFTRTAKHTASMIIEDSGKGIPQDILPDIFKPYVSGNASGYGIGLAIVKRIAEKSGWEIRIDSEENKGTQVIISNIRISP